jgi:hypothetical protein
VDVVENVSNVVESLFDDRHSAMAVRLGNKVVPQSSAFELTYNIFSCMSSSSKDARQV